MYWVNGLYTINVNGVPTFQAANPQAGIPNGTEITAQWLADVQGELLAWPDRAGIAPAPNTPNQVLASAIAMFSPFPVYVTADQNVPVPVWATRCFQRLWGAGGSGSVASSANQRGAGGGAGCYIECIETGLSGGTSTINCVIGVGGAGVGSGAGNPGTSTSTGAAATALGGTGGGNFPYAGGQGGGGAVSTTIAQGVVFGAQDGGDGSPNTTESGGNGGGPFGGRGATNNGFSGKSAGGGGGGCAQGFTSGSGANGLIILHFLP